MVESFWTIPDVSTIRTPLSILREQASAITEQTKGALVGVAEARNTGPRLILQLDLTVPALNDYRYSVLRYSQPIEMYPGTLFAGDRGVQVGDEQSFIEGVKAVLSSSEMTKVLASLLVQVNDA